MLKYHKIARLASGCLAAGAVAAGCASFDPLVTLPPEIPEHVLIRDVAVLDVITGSRVERRDVLISGNRITRIAGGGSIEPPPRALAIDGTGATLLPGLIDAHAHIANGPAPSWLGKMPNPEANLLSYLYCGVTTVFDPGGLITQTFERRERLASGELLGPTLYTAGPVITAPDGHPIGFINALAPWWIRWYIRPRATSEVNSPEEARSSVTELDRAGADFIKLIVDSIPADSPRLRGPVIEAAVDEAHRRGLRAVAHIGTTRDALDAAEAGADAWMHGVYKEHIPEESIRAMASYDIPVVVTMVVFESYALLGQGQREPSPLELETAEADLLAAFNDVPDSAVPDGFADYMETLRRERLNWRDNVRRLHQAGVQILVGSDAQSGVFPGPGLHRELALLVESGLSPAEAIGAATVDAARFLTAEESPDFGILAEGKRADLLLVNGNPLDDVAVLSRIRAVIKNGVVLDRHPVKQQG